MPEFTTNSKQKMQSSTFFKHSLKQTEAEKKKTTYNTSKAQNSSFFESSQIQKKQFNLGSPSLQSEYKANYALTNSESPVFQYKTPSLKSTKKNGAEYVKMSPALAESDSGSATSSEDGVILCPIMALSSSSKRSTARTLTQKQTQGSVEHQKFGNKKAVVHEKTAESAVPLFIGDLDQIVDEKYLRTHFQRFKSIESIKICKNPKRPTELNYAYINFKDPAEAAAALKHFNYKPIMGKDVRMMYSFRDKTLRHKIGTNVFVSGLPLTDEKLTTRAFYEKFLSFGNILSCKLDKRKSIGFVYFEKKTAALAAIDFYNNNVFFGKPIKCGIHFEKSVRDQSGFDKQLQLTSGNRIFKEDIDTATLNSCIPAITKSELNPMSVESFVQSSSSVSVSNVSKFVQVDEILDHFCKTGPIKSVYIFKKNCKSNAAVAYITYKKTADALQCIKLFDGSPFQGLKIQVKLSLPKNSYQSLKEKFQSMSLLVDESSKANVDSNGDYGDMLISPKQDSYKQTVYLNNLSKECDTQFLQMCCTTNDIKATEIFVDMVNMENRTCAGYVCCGTKQDSEKLFGLLNNAKVGNCFVKCSWKPTVSNKYLYNNKEIEY
ncbi:hypothetical protein ACO0QE_003922 [Hanseniaspora vineae]